jgi:hypothetical protein
VFTDIKSFSVGAHHAGRDDSVDLFPDESDIFGSRPCRKHECADDQRQRDEAANVGDPAAHRLLSSAGVTDAVAIAASNAARTGW